MILFTNIDRKKEDYELELDKVYLHLLELYGYFQAVYYGWKKIKIPIEKVIMKGDYKKNLATYLEQNNIGIKAPTQNEPDTSRRQLMDIYFGVYMNPYLIRKRFTS